MGKLVIMNFANDSIDIYNTPTDFVDEDYIEDMGYNTSNNIEWMSAPNITITIH